MGVRSDKMSRAKQQIAVLEEYVNLISQQLLDAVQLLQRLDAAVVVRDPGNARSAEAFDGLRKTVLASMKARRSHIAHLLSLSDSIERGASIETIGERVSDFLNEIGLRYVNDTTHADWFDVVEGEGEILECVTPAVVDESELGSMLIRAGTARRVPAPEPLPTAQESSASDEDREGGSELEMSPSETIAAPTSGDVESAGSDGAPSLEEASDDNSSQEPDDAHIQDDDEQSDGGVR